MPYQTTPPIDFSEFGLVTDVPSNSAPTAAWSENNNLRVKDSSVQGVNAFADSFTINASYLTGKPVAVTQYTPAGKDYLYIVYIIESQEEGEVGKGRVFVRDTNTGQDAEITNTTDATCDFTIDANYPPQVFVANEVLIMNPGDGVGCTQFIALTDNITNTLEALPNQATALLNQSPRICRVFNNRLVAMNLVDDGGTTVGTDDTFHQIDFVWSSVFTDIGSLANVSWSAATTNTAGDAFLTGTPGKILDGAQLGDAFIVKKTDAIVRVTETGDTTFPLIFETIFEDDGMYSTSCSATIGNNEELVVGNYGVYIHDGQTTKKDIAKGIFQEALYKLVNPSHRNRSFVFRQTRDKEVWFCLSSAANAGGGCDTAFVYNYADKKLHRRTIPNILSMYETEVNGELRIFAASPDTNKILELSDSVLEADGYFTVTNKFSETSHMSKSIISIYPEAVRNFKLAVSGTYALGAGPFTDQTVTGHKVDLRVSGQYLHIRVTMDGVINPELTTMKFIMKTNGER